MDSNLFVRNLVARWDAFLDSLPDAEHDLLIQQYRAILRDAATSPVDAAILGRAVEAIRTLLSSFTGGDVLVLRCSSNELLLYTEDAHTTEDEDLRQIQNHCDMLWELGGREARSPQEARSCLGSPHQQLRNASRHDDS